MIDIEHELRLVEKEGAKRYTDEQRKELKDVSYLCQKMVRHALNLSLGKTHDPGTGIHNITKILWYILRLCKIYGINIKIWD